MRRDGGVCRSFAQRRLFRAAVQALSCPHLPNI